MFRCRKMTTPGTAQELGTARCQTELLKEEETKELLLLKLNYNAHITQPPQTKVRKPHIGREYVATFSA